MNTENPQLIKAAEGFSVLYNGRYLYSKYKPTASICTLIDSLNIEPNTYFICFSPVLGYGLAELLEKLPESCRVICIESNKDLYDFSLLHLQKTLLKDARLEYIFCPNEQIFSNFMAYSPNKPNLGNFRRIRFFDLSAGTQFSNELYSHIKFLAEDFLSTFWKNRLTLTHFAKLYARNIIRNIPRLANSQIIQKQSITKPILVLGAGPSIDKTVDRLIIYRDLFFIIAADSVITPLLQRGIRPDVVIALESQIANEKAFIGSISSGVPFVADITSRPTLIRSFAKYSPTSFIFSEFAQMRFLERFKPLLHSIPQIPPLGSVGLAAVELALLLRKSEHTQIYFTGLDFSFSPAKTHCRSAPSSLNTLSTHDRIHSLQNAFYAFQEGARTAIGKSGKTLYTTPALLGYASMLSARYADVPHVFDIATEGLATDCSQLPIETLIEQCKKNQNALTKNKVEKEEAFFTKDKTAQITNSKSFIQNEITQLTKLRDLLIHGGSEEERNAILIECDYLYLHFPDGHLGVQNTLSFLKRVRAEIDVFLKDLTSALRFL